MRVLPRRAHDDVHLFADGAGGIPLYQPPVCQVGRALVVGRVEVEYLFGFPALAFGSEHVNPGNGILQVGGDCALFLHEELSGEHLFFNRGIYAPVYFFGRYEFGNGIAHFSLLASWEVFQGNAERCFLCLVHLFREFQNGQGFAGVNGNSLAAFLRFPFAVGDACSDVVCADIGIFFKLGSLEGQFKVTFCVCHYGIGAFCRCVRGIPALDLAGDFRVGKGYA